MSVTDAGNSVFSGGEWVTSALPSGTLARVSWMCCCVLDCVR